MRSLYRLAAQSIALGCGLCLWVGAWIVLRDGTVTPTLAVHLAPLALGGLLALYLSRPLEV